MDMSKKDMYKNDWSFLDLSKNDVSFLDMSFLDELQKCYLEVFFEKFLESTQFKFNLDKICYYTIF